MKYIGRRKSSYVDYSYLGSGKLIKEAVLKYGRESFSLEVLEVCDTKEDLNKAEEKWIEFYDATTSDEFYNIRKSSFPQLEGRHHSDESKRKISESHLGKPHIPEETRMRMSDNMKGSNNPMYESLWITDGSVERVIKKGEDIPEGFYLGMTEDHRNKISQSLTGENHPMYDKHHSESTLVKMSLAHSGENHHMYGKHLPEETRRRISETLTGRKHTESTLKKRSQMRKGEGNPSYGTRMINNGIINKRIPKEDPTPDGWYNGMCKKIVSSSTIESITTGNSSSE